MFYILFTKRNKNKEEKEEKEEIEEKEEKMIYNTSSVKIQEIFNIETFNECYPYGIEILNYA